MSKARKFARRALDKWLKPLGLLWRDVTILFYSDKKAVRRIFGHKRWLTVAARCFADWRYGTVTLQVNLLALKGMDFEHVEAIILHELCHALVNEMREGEIHHEERVVTELTKAFAWVYKAGKGTLQ